jgi:diguanylate cyclase (GGDEF)-like protein
MIRLTRPSPNSARDHGSNQGQFMSALAEEPLGVVVVDDDPIYRETICAKVAKKSNFVIFEASSGNDLFDILRVEQIDCIVLDYDLGEESGFAVMQRMDETYSEPPPIIMMTGGGRESTAIRAFRMGVCDYLPKTGLQAEHLVTSVIKVVEQDRLERLTKIEHKRLLAASGVDFVTGLEGRARLEERLTQLVLLPPLSRVSYALILVEFLEYQTVKERFGLKIVDRSLRAFGQRLQELGRSSDVCGRYSEATFLVIAGMGSGAGNLNLVCRRLADNLSLRLNLDLADISITACVAGSMCSETLQLDQADGLYLLEPVTVMLAQAKWAKLSWKTSRDGCLDASPAVDYQPSDSKTSESSAAASRPDARPAADELRATDRRRHIRHRVLKRGLIHTIDNKATFNCTVRNISSHGAGLRIDAAFPVPATFDLEIAGSGERQRVRVRWQTGVNLGVEFVDVITS